VTSLALDQSVSSKTPSIDISNACTDWAKNKSPNKEEKRDVSFLCNSVSIMRAAILNVDCIKIYI